jgi:lysophospholipase L1-like esterase
MNTRRSYLPIKLFPKLRLVIAAGWLLRIQCLAVWALVIGCTTRHAAADPNYIADLTFFDRSPGSPRAKPYEPVLRLDANDTSFAGAAGWGDGFNSWQQQFDHTKALAAAHPNSGLVFIGDSVTQNWGNVNGREVNGSGAGIWNSATYNYSRFDALNFGIAGDQTQNVIYRVDNGQFDGLNPGLVVLMIGTNNRFAPTSNPGFPIEDYPAPPHTAEEIADGVLATVQAIHQKLPNSHVLTLSTIRGLNNSDPDRIAVSQANSLVSQAFTIDTNPLLDYLDVSGLYRNADGTLNGNINSDGVHFNSAGYAALANAIAPYINQYAIFNPATAVINVAPHGTASWTNSVDGAFGHFAKDAIDDNQDTFANSDFDGSSGGNPAKPDILTVQLDKTYNLKNIQIVNRGASDGGSAFTDARLNGVLLQVLGSNGSDVLYSTTLADDPTLFGETLTLDNGGQGFAGAKFIRLTANNFLNVSEIRANISAVPEPSTLSLFAVGCLSGGLILRQSKTVKLRVHCARTNRT